MPTEIDPTRDGCLPCPDCGGTGEVDDSGDLVPCASCEGERFFHPFMSFEEYAEQVRERHPDAVFVIPGDDLK